MSFEIIPKESLDQFQKRQEVMTDKLKTLYQVQAVANHPAVAKVINVLERQTLNGLSFPEAPMFQVPSLEQLTEGSIVIGKTLIAKSAGKEQEIAVTIPRESMPWGVLIAGATGSGKSACIFNILRQIQYQNKMSFIYFAVEGNESKQLQSLGVHALLLGENYRFNILDYTEGLDIEIQVSDLCDAFTSLWIGVKSRAFLTPIIRELLEESKNGRPKDIRDLYEAVRKAKSCEIKDALLNKLEILRACKIFHTISKNNIELIGNNNIVFQLDSIHTLAQGLFINCIAIKLMRWKELLNEHRKEVSQQHITAIVVDECQSYLESSYSTKDDVVNTPLIKLLNRGRKRGLAPIYALPRPSVVDSTPIGQSGTVISGVLTHADDVRSIRDALNFDKNQTQFFSSMPRRSFVCRISGLNAIPMEVPELPLYESEYVSPDEWNKPILEQNPELEKLLYKGEEKKQIINPPVEKDDIWILLDCINSNPCHPISFYTKILKKNFEIQKFYQVKSQAEEKRFIKCHKILTGLRHQIGIEILEKGYTHYDFRRNFFLWRGSGFIHSYLAEATKLHFQKKGKIVVREKQLGDHWADLWIEQDKLAVEIAVGNKPEIEAQNIEKDLLHAENVLVIGNDREHLQKVMKHFSIAGKVQFKLFCDLK